MVWKIVFFILAIRFASSSLICMIKKMLNTKWVIRLPEMKVEPLSAEQKSHLRMDNKWRKWISKMGRFGEYWFSLLTVGVFEWIRLDTSAHTNSPAVAKLNETEEIIDIILAVNQSSGIHPSLTTELLVIRCKPNIARYARFPISTTLRRRSKTKM